jgi:hypothetical protein
VSCMAAAIRVRHPDDPRALLLVAPGWVRTEMGGGKAILEISDSIPLVVDMVERNAECDLASCVVRKAPKSKAGAALSKSQLTLAVCLKTRRRVLPRLRVRRCYLRCESSASCLVTTSCALL